MRFSSDQGVTWQQPAIPLPVYAVAGSPRSPNVLFAGTPGGIFKSLDSGNTWSLLPTTSTYNVQALAVDPLNPNLVTAATIGGTFQSKDAGATWIAVNPGVSNVFVLALNPARPATLYTATDDWYGFVVFAAADAASPDVPPASIYRTITLSTFTLSASPAGVYLGTPAGLLISRDGGVTWTPTSITAPAGNSARQSGMAP